MPCKCLGDKILKPREQLVQRPWGRKMSCLFKEQQGSHFPRVNEQRGDGLEMALSRVAM